MKRNVFKIILQLRSWQHSSWSSNCKVDGRWQTYDGVLRKYKSSNTVSNRYLDRSSNNFIRYVITFTNYNLHIFQFSSNFRRWVSTVLKREWNLLEKNLPNIDIFLSEKIQSGINLTFLVIVDIFNDRYFIKNIINYTPISCWIIYLKELSNFFSSHLSLLCLHCKYKMYYFKYMKYLC